jgi:hypothetical protein
MIEHSDKPFAVRFVDLESKVVLELINVTDQSFKSVEILTVFLKDESPRGGPSQAHIRFDTVSAILPKTNVALSHKTWTNGRAVEGAADQLARLKTVTGATKPYVLDISWEDAEGRTRFQRIPVGH